MKNVIQISSEDIHGHICVHCWCIFRFEAIVVFSYL